MACHNDRARSGNLSLQSFDVATAGQHAEITEKMIRKLRAGQMPPRRQPAARPTRCSTRLADALEAQADARAADARAGPPHVPAPEPRRVHAQSIRDLLALDINAGDYLPLDTKSANFDNIADAQLLSPTLMQGYLTAAAEISRLAVGDRGGDGARGDLPGVALDLAARAGRGRAVRHARRPRRSTHTFPADGDYRFRVSFYHETTGALYGNGRAALHTAEAPEQVEISIDGARVALLDIDRWMNTSDPDGVNLRTEPIRDHRRPAPRVGGVHPPASKGRCRT